MWPVGLHSVRLSIAGYLILYTELLAWATSVQIVARRRGPPQKQVGE
jgi:hypothetical protein